MAFVIPNLFSAKFKIEDPFTNYETSFKIANNLLIEIQIFASYVFPQNVVITEFVSLLYAVMSLILYYLNIPYISITTQKLKLTRVQLELLLILLELWLEHGPMTSTLKGISLFLEILSLSFSLKLSSRMSIALNKIDFFDTTNISSARKGFMFYCHYIWFLKKSKIRELDIFYSGLFEAHSKVC